MQTVIDVLQQLPPLSVLLALIVGVGTIIAVDILSRKED